MINNPKLINKIKQQLKNTTKKQLDKAIKMNEKSNKEVIEK